MTAHEFLAFMQTRGVDYRTLMIHGGGHGNVAHLTDFLFGLLNTVYYWASQVYSKVGVYLKILSKFHCKVSSKIRGSFKQTEHSLS